MLFIGQPPSAGSDARPIKMALEFAFRTSAAGLDGGIAGGLYEVEK